MERVRNPLDTDAAAQTYDIAHGPHIRMRSRIPHPAGLCRSEQQSLQAVRHALAFPTWRSLTQPQRESTEIGVLLSFEEPSAGMRSETAEAAFYDSPWGRHPAHPAPHDPGAAGREGHRLPARDRRECHAPSSAASADGRARGDGAVRPGRAGDKSRVSAACHLGRDGAPRLERDAGGSETRGLCVPPEQAIGQALDAALAVEQFIAGLSTEHVTTVEREETPRLVDPSINRTEHLDEIEAVLG